MSKIVLFQGLGWNFWYFVNLRTLLYKSS